MKQSEQKHPMQEIRTWREQLSISIRNSEERKRIAHQVGVNPLTITRWAKNESSPHKQSLQKLFTILPECQQELTELADGEVQQVVEVDATTILPLYTQVLSTYSLTPPSLLFWSISQLILQHALSQLTVGRNVVEIVITQCTPPSRNGMVRSLQEIMSGNSANANSIRDRKRTFLGVESLAGSVLASPRRKVVQDFAEERYFYPRTLDIGEECSCVACPILHANRIAGCLLVSSTTPNYFSLQKQDLIEQYAELFALAFDEKTFYPLSVIELYPMPHPDEQHKHMLTFHQRVRQMLKKAGHTQPLTVVEAEQRVWQQIEQELIEMVLQREEMA